VPYTYTNLASAWLRDETTTAPQRVLASLFQSSGQYVAGTVGDDKYAFVSSVLGELKLDVNGKVLPVFPANPMTVTQLHQNLGSMSVTLACDQVRLDQVRQGVQSTATPYAQRFQEQQLFDVVAQNVEHENVLDLFSLDPPDRAVACNALGRALGNAALRRCGENARSATATALQNPKLPDQIRETYEARASQTFTAMVSAAEADREHSVPRIKDIIHQMALVKMRRTQGETAATAKTLQDEEDEFVTTPCDSEETCRP
jgi:hypothetical protein